MALTVQASFGPFLVNSASCSARRCSTTTCIDQSILLLQENQHGPRRAGSAKPSVPQPVSRDVAILSCCWQPCPLADLHIPCTRHRVRMLAREALCSLVLWPHNRSLSCSPPTCTQVCPLAAPCPTAACTVEQTVHLVKQASCTAQCQALPSAAVPGQLQADELHPIFEAVSGSSMSAEVLAAGSCACISPQCILTSHEHAAVSSDAEMLSSSSSNGSHRVLPPRSSPHTWLDIDVDDAEDPQACAEYVNEITSYLLQAEVRATASTGSITAVGMAAAIPASSLCVWPLAGKTPTAGPSPVGPF